MTEPTADRRVAFFLIAAVVCLLLTPLAPSEFVSLCLIVAATYVLLAALTALDRWSRNRSAEDRSQ